MAKYRKKPVVVEAVQLTDKMRTGIENLPAGVQRSCVGGGLFIDALKGIMRAEVGDWIIKDVQGEPYLCKSGIFEQTYKKVEV